jgi:hypothetical protein
MSYSVSTLLTRNLHDVFGENDPARRRGAIDEIFTEDCVFYDPSKGVYRGRDEIDRIAGAIRATHPDSSSTPCGRILLFFNDLQLHVTGVAPCAPAGSWAPAGT